jgi:hypothetical protein
MKLSIREAKIMNSFVHIFQNFKKVGFLKIQISKISDLKKGYKIKTIMLCNKIRLHSNSKMILSICDAKIMNSFGDIFKS